MNSPRFCTFLFLLAVTTVEVDGQSPTPSATSSPPLNAEAVLNHAIELTGQLDERLIATVYWCLGTLVAVLVILVGYNWFTNFRAYQREGLALRQQIASDIGALKAELTGKIQEHLESQKSEIDKRVSDSTKAIQSQLEGYVQSELKSLKSDLGQLQATALANEREAWTSKGVHKNAFTTQMQYLRHVQKTGYEWQVQQGLDTLETILRKCNTEASKPDASDIAALTAFLKSVEENNPIVVASIQSVVRELRA